MENFGFISSPQNELENFLLFDEGQVLIWRKHIKSEFNYNYTHNIQAVCPTYSTVS